MRQSAILLVLLAGCSKSEPPPQRIIIEHRGGTLDSASVPKVDAEELKYAEAMMVYFKIHEKANPGDAEFSIVSSEFLEEAEAIKERSKADAATFVHEWTDGVKAPQEFVAKWRAKHPGR